MSRRPRDDRQGMTEDPRRQDLHEDRQRQAERQRKRDLVVLLAMPEFRRFMADLVYSRLRLKAGGAWKRDSEIHREAARRDVAAELLVDLAAIDAEGFLRLEQEHLNQLATEAKASGQLTQEKVDA